MMGRILNQCQDPEKTNTWRLPTMRRLPTLPPGYTQRPSRGFESKIPLKLAVDNKAAVNRAVDVAVNKLDGNNIVVNNAPSISLTDTVDIEMKRSALMNSIHTRGTSHLCGISNLDAAMCCICQGIVPHSQLSVCTKPSCCYAYGADVYATPTEFFSRVEVFCGQCILYRNYCKHWDHLQPALPLAIETSSHMTGETLAEKYRKVAVLNQSSLVDYVIFVEFETESLEVPKIAEYLSNSNTTSEWNTKKEQFEQFLVTLENNRIAGLDYVKRLAEESLLSYKQLIRDTETVLKLKERDLFEFQQAEHKAKMCESKISEEAVEAGKAAHSGFRNMEQAFLRSSIAPSCSLFTDAQ